MTDPIESSATAPRLRAGPGVWLAALLVVLACVGTNFYTIAEAVRGSFVAGTLGGSFVAQNDAARTSMVVGLVPGLPLAAAGVREGDRIRFDHIGDDHRRFAAGETYGLTVVSAARPRHVVVTTVAESPAARASLTWLDALDAISALCSTLVALLIVWRSERRLSLIALGLFFALPNITVNVFTALPVDWPGQIARILIAAPPLPALVAFAVLFYRENVAAVGRRIWWGVAAYALAALVFAVCVQSYIAAGVPLLPFGVLATLLQLSGMGAATIGLVYGWMQSTREARRRYLMVLAAIALMLISVAIQLIDSLIGIPLFQSPLLWAFELVSTISPLLFGYAVLRHRVLDLGFVVNRTLVYAVISFLLLIAFGLIEWGTERFLPHATLEASALINAGVALTIFLTFHRIRDWVERTVEKLLFSSWHRNEAVLRRFVRQAGFIGKPEALTAAAVAEFARFSGGAPCAVHTRAGEGFARIDGAMPGVPAIVDGDDPAVVAMRSDQGAVERTRLAALALPMVHRADLGGFILLGEKPSGDDYRPDEVEVLAWAAQQIGLDLRALEGMRLEAEAARQAQEMTLLRARYDELHAAMAPARR